MSKRPVKRDLSSAAGVSQALHTAFPVNSGTEYVTRKELANAIGSLDSKLETKIENSVLRMKLWVVMGALATLASIFASSMYLVAKIDRLVQEMPQLASVQAERSSWIQRTEQRDGKQDDALRKLDRNYEPLPYREPPQ